MQFNLKSISSDGITKALERVERYRLLNEPSLAESICLDILAITPSHQQALVSLLLARTDQFDHGVPMKSAQEVLQRIDGEYERAYYAGLIWERQAHAHLRQQASAATPTPITRCARPWCTTSTPKLFARMEMMMQFCDGMLARVY